MATKFHVNPETGKVGPCSAGKTGEGRGCPFGGETGTENHYDTAEQAQAAYDAQQQSVAVPTAVKRTSVSALPLAEQRELAQEKMNHGLDRLRSGSVWPSDPGSRARFSDALGDALNWSAHQKEEYASKLTEQGGPDQFWFSDSVMGFHSAKVYYDHYSLFRVQGQTVSPAAQSAIIKVNRALKDRNLQRNSSNLYSKPVKVKPVIKSLENMGADKAVLEKLSAPTPRWKPTEKDMLGIYHDAFEEHNQSRRLGGYFQSRISGFHFAKESLTDRERAMLTDMETLLPKQNGSGTQS